MEIKIKVSRAFSLYVLIFIMISCNENKINKSVDISKSEEKNKGITKISYYNGKGGLEKTLEFINLCGKKYLNQGWHFNKKGDTLLDKSHFYKVSAENKVLGIREQTTIKIYYKPLFKNTVSAFLLSKGNLLKEDYCNLNELDVDTLYFVDNKLKFSIGFKDSGIKNLGGYILEVSKEIRPDRSYSERKVYLKIPFEVK